MTTPTEAMQVVIDERDRLRVAMQDLLSELRIDPYCLEVMSRGYCPDYPGAVDWPADDPQWKNPYCRVQLSKVMAVKLIAAEPFSDSKP